MIDTVVTRFGLARMPFGRDLPPSRLHRHAGCGEAAARIAWAVSDKTIGMITGEVGTGKTVAARAACDCPPALRSPACSRSAHSTSRSKPSLPITGTPAAGRPTIPAPWQAD
jgi:hypothetical protein